MSSIREIAEKIVARQAAEVRMGSDTSDMSQVEPQRVIGLASLTDAIEQALRDERERAANIAEAHYTDAVACNGGAECSLNIAAAIRKDEVEP